MGSRRQDTLDIPRIGCLVSDAHLAVLYNLLYRTGRINCDLELFTAPFTGTSIAYVKWYGSDVEFIQLFSDFIDDMEIIPKHAKYIQMLCKFFCNADGTLFDPDSLRTLNTREPNEFVIQFKKVLLEEFAKLNQMHTMQP